MFRELYLGFDVKGFSNRKYMYISRFIKSDNHYHSFARAQAAQYNFSVGFIRGLS
jgi:hypothetical protein